MRRRRTAPPLDTQNKPVPVSTSSARFSFTPIPQKMSGNKAKEAADELNGYLDSGMGLKEMFDKKYTNFTWNSPGHMELRHPMKEVKQWYLGAPPVIDLAIKKQNLRFGYGNLGSVWLDVDNVEVDGKKKKVRFYVSGVNNNGFKFDLGMDATFEEKW